MNREEVLARRRVLQDAWLTTAPHLHRTPLWHSSRLSASVGAQVFLKLETFQKTGSFKVRGMLHKVRLIAQAGRAAGVVTFSAGNAAQGLAYAARAMQLPATILMTPEADPAKIEATKAYGAKVSIAEPGEDLLRSALALAERERLSFVHPFDDIDLMTGHASLALEVLEQLPEVSTLITAIGGGGMAGGLALLNAASQRPLRLIGIEPEFANHMQLSLARGQPVTLSGTTIADGLNPPSVGEKSFELVRHSFECVMLVSDAEIVAAMRMLLLNFKVLAEPSGAAALAGLLSRQLHFEPHEQIVVIVSGGNISPDRLRRLL